MNTIQHMLNNIKSIGQNNITLICSQNPSSYTYIKHTNIYPIAKYMKIPNINHIVKFISYHLIVNFVSVEILHGSLCKSTASTVSHSALYPSNCNLNNVV